MKNKEIIVLLFRYSYIDNTVIAQTMGRETWKDNNTEKYAVDFLFGRC